MKKITIYFILLITAEASFSQKSNPSPAVTQQDYLKKSKNQKILAFSLLGGGIGLITSGVILFGNSESKGEQESKIILSGLVSSIVSIPFFISSHNNKKKAMVVAFKKQAMPVVSNSSFVYKTIPSIHIKINI